MNPADQAEVLSRLDKRLKASAATIADLDTQLKHTVQSAPPARRAPSPPMPALTRSRGGTTYVDPGPQIGQELVPAPELTEHLRTLTEAVRILLVVVGRLVVAGAGRTTVLVWVTTATSLFAGVAALVLAIILWVTLR